MFSEFITEMGRFVPPHARIVFNQFRGDPAADTPSKWRVHVLNDIAMVDQTANVYLCVSAMGRNSKGEFRRRKENFAGGLLLMIDDLGSGPGSKFPLDTISPLQPTALIETSPDNYQAVYLFDRLVEDIGLFDALIRGFIQRQFLGQDTGQAGVNRVFRPPIGVNGKPKYNGWAVRCASWLPGRRYAPETVAQAFGIPLVRDQPRPRGACLDTALQIRDFIRVRAALRSAGMLKRDEPDQGGWVPIRCPWVEFHTNQEDNGAAIREPDAENAFVGGFKCWHGHCQDKRWKDVTDWLAEEQGTVLEMINARASRSIYNV